MKSPGHQTWPDHQVREEHLDERVLVEINGEIVADSRDIIRVDEDESPPRYYFPRADVRMEKLEPSDTESQCPFKGHAHYFTVNAGGKRLEDAVWTYEEPYDEHRALKDRVAFWDEKAPEIRIREGEQARA